MAKSKFVQANEKIADAVVGGYKKIEEGVVIGYKKIEDGVTGAFKKVEDGFVDQFLTHEGETVEDAKKRLAEEHPSLKTPAKESVQKRAGAHQVPSADIGKISVEASVEKGRASVEASKNVGKGGK